MFLEFVGGLDLDGKKNISRAFPKSMRFATRWKTLVDSGPGSHVGVVLIFHFHQGLTKSSLMKLSINFTSTLAKLMVMHTKQHR